MTILEDSKQFLHTMMVSQDLKINSRRTNLCLGYVEKLITEVERLDKENKTLSLFIRRYHR